MLDLISLGQSVARQIVITAALVKLIRRIINVDGQCRRDVCDKALPQRQGKECRPMTNVGVSGAGAPLTNIWRVLLFTSVTCEAAAGNTCMGEIGAQ